MRRFKLILLPVSALVIAMAITLGSNTYAGTEDVTSAIQSLNTKWDDALNGGNAAAIAALYAEHGRVVTGDGKVINGRTEIQKLFQGFIDSGFHDHKIELIDVRVNGDIAIETAKWSGVGGDKKNYGGHLVNVFKRQAGGEWQGILHIWN